jgi:hypothetical protein
MPRLGDPTTKTMKSFDIQMDYQTVASPGYAMDAAPTGRNIEEAVIKSKSLQDPGQKRPCCLESSDSGSFSRSRASEGGKFLGRQVQLRHM